MTKYLYHNQGSNVCDSCGKQFIASVIKHKDIY